MVHSVQKMRNSRYRSAISLHISYSWAKLKETRGVTPSHVVPDAKQQQRFTTKPALRPSKGHAGRAEIAFGTCGAQGELLVELDVLLFRITQI